MNKHEPPMRIYIKNLSNTLNYGTMMMGENLISELRTRLERLDVEFYIDTDQDIHVIRLKEATGYSAIFSDQIEFEKLWTRNIRFVRYFEKRLRKKSVLRKLVAFYDAIIILGGDDYAETYYSLPKDNILIRSIFKDLGFLSHRMSVIMLGQTIGPFTGKRIKYARDGLKETMIYVRDHQSQDYLKQELLLDSVLSTDLAFLNLHLQTEYQKNYLQILGSYGLIEGQYLTLVGTGLIRHYTSDVNQFVDTFKQLIDRLIERFPNHKIVILSHVSNKDSAYSDNAFIELIDQNEPGFLSSRCVIIREPLLPVEARILLGHGYLTISCRMHAAVSTFQMGTPAICLSYSKKFGGVIGENLKCPELVIQAKGNDFWRDDPIEIIMGKVDYVCENWNELNTRIKKEIRKNQDVLDQTLTDLIRRFEDS